MIVKQGEYKQSGWAASSEGGLIRRHTRWSVYFLWLRFPLWIYIQGEYVFPSSYWWVNLIMIKASAQPGWMVLWFRSGAIILILLGEDAENECFYCHHFWHILILLIAKKQDRSAASCKLKTKKSSSRRSDCEFLVNSCCPWDKMLEQMFYWSWTELLSQKKN